jgi:hypothetical protein
MSQVYFRRCQRVLGWTGCPRSLQMSLEYCAVLMWGRPCGSHVNRGMPTHVVLCQAVLWVSPLLQPGLLPSCLLPPPSVLGPFPAILGWKGKCGPLAYSSYTLPLSMAPDYSTSRQLLWWSKTWSSTASEMLMGEKLQVKEPMESLWGQENVSS